MTYASNTFGVAQNIRDILSGVVSSIIGKVAAGGVVDSAGNIVFPDAFANTMTYNADGTVATISFTDGVNTWTQTFTYTTGNLTNVSKWVKS